MPEPAGVSTEAKNDPQMQQKAAETAGASVPKAQQDDHSSKSRAGNEDGWFNKLTESFGEKYSSMKEDVENNQKFSLLLNERDGGNLKTKDLLAGKGEAHEVKAARKNLQSKQQAFESAKKASGDGNWANVCEPMAKVLEAYLELRQAEGHPDTMLGRFGSLFVAPVENVVDDAAGFIGGVTDFISTFFKDEKIEPLPPANDETPAPNALSSDNGPNVEMTDEVEEALDGLSSGPKGP